MYGLERGHIDDVSFSLRALLRDICPEMVTAVEDFTENVTYIPVSTIGHSPVRKGDGLYVNPADVRPFWAAIPFLYAFSRLGLIYRAYRRYPDAIPRASLVGRLKDLMFCALPDGSRIEVPARFAGKWLHNPRDGQPFIAPGLSDAPPSPAPTGRPV